MIAVLALVLACALQTPAEPSLGFFPLDPVRLVRDGVEEDGELELATVHALWEYRFVSAATRAELLAAPDRYAIQLGGACGRMGALSGTGNPHLHAVHEGRLYLFASDS
jgi:hypothetical protein